MCECLTINVKLKNKNKYVNLIKNKCLHNINYTNIIHNINYTNIINVM